MTLMPSRDYSRMTDEDFAALVAYVRSLPPVAGEAAVIRQPLIVQALYAFGVIKDDAELIDQRCRRRPGGRDRLGRAWPVCRLHVHRMPRRRILGRNDSRHASRLAAAANLTPGGGSAMASYDSPGKFAAMLRTGKRPDGGAVSPVMPFETLRNLNDTDVGALYAFLKTLPARPAGGRSGARRLLVRLEPDARHLPVVFGLGRHRDFGAVGRVDATAAAPARVALVLAGAHFRMFPAQGVGLPAYSMAVCRGASLGPDTQT